MIYLAIYLGGFTAGFTTAIIWACCRAAARRLPTGGSAHDARAFGAMASRPAKSARRQQMIAELRAAIRAADDKIVGAEFSVAAARRNQTARRCELATQEALAVLDAFKSKIENSKNYDRQP